MPRARPRAVRRYSDEFKLTAVRLSHQPGMQVKTVAAALEIHPFMLSKWRKDVRDGLIRGRTPKAPPPGLAREIAQLQALEKAHALTLAVGGQPRGRRRVGTLASPAVSGARTVSDAVLVVPCADRGPIARLHCALPAVERQSAPRRAAACDDRLRCATVPHRPVWSDDLDAHRSARRIRWDRALAVLGVVL